MKTFGVKERKRDASKKKPEFEALKLLVKRSSVTQPPLVNEARGVALLGMVAPEGLRDDKNKKGMLKAAMLVRCT